MGGKSCLVHSVTPSLLVPFVSALLNRMVIHVINAVLQSSISFIGIKESSAFAGEKSSMALLVILL